MWPMRKQSSTALSQESGEFHMKVLGIKHPGRIYVWGSVEGR